jgi:hypothetical protein
MLPTRERTRSMDTTKVRYQVPDTRAMRECIDQALAQLRHEAELERARWAAYGELLGAVA